MNCAELNDKVNDLFDAYNSLNRYVDEKIPSAGMKTAYKHMLDNFFESLIHLSVYTFKNCKKQDVKDVGNGVSGGAPRKVKSMTKPKTKSRKVAKAVKPKTTKPKSKPKSKSKSKSKPKSN